MTSAKTLLMLGGSIYLVRTIEAVRDAGYRAVVVDRDPDAPGLAVADVSHAIDMVDADAVLALAREERVDGVMPLTDFGVPTAAHVALGPRPPRNDSSHRAARLRQGPHAQAVGA